MAQLMMNKADWKGNTCQPVGNGDYTLQVGADVALKITIEHQKAPRETMSCP